MLYMVIEHFYPGKLKEIYQRLAEKGRLMPEGVNYVNSWIDEELNTCYQVMDCESREGLQQWMDNWEGFAAFEVIPVITSAEAKEKALKG